MARSCVGLDIGTSAVKVVQISRNGNRYRLDRVGVAPLPIGAIDGGTVINIPAVAQVVVRLLRQSRINCRRVMVAVAGEAVIHRTLKLPILPKKEFDGVVRFESEKHIPFSLDDAVYDYDVIAEVPETNEQEILLVAAQRSIIESHLAVLKLAKLQALAVDVQPLALSRALQPYLAAGGEEVEGNIAVLDVGAGTSDLAIFHQGVQRFIRIIPIGGNYFTRAIARRLEISDEAAESLKITRGQVVLDDQPSDSPEDAMLYSAISSVMVELTMEIRRSIDYFRLQFHEDIARLVTTGGGIVLRNMDAYLARDLGLRVEIGDPMISLQGAVMPKQITAAGPIFCVAIGLGLRGVQE